MVQDNFQKILETIQRLEQRMGENFKEVREEMQGGFALTNQRIAQSEETIKHVLESVLELNNSLEERVSKIEEKLSSSHPQ